MYGVALILACLAWYGHGQQIYDPITQAQGSEMSRVQQSLKSCAGLLVLHVSEAEKREAFCNPLRWLAIFLLAFNSAAPLEHSNSGTSIKLASGCCSPHFPTTVLVHGLDSSRETFTGTLARLLKDGYPCLTLDLRGHGESPFGNPDEFSARTLAADVLAAVRNHGVDRAVLLGHSMGGRVAMRAAAMDAASEKPCLASIIIEDMDVRKRDSSRSISDDEQKIIDCFASSDGRRFTSWEAARDALLPWYDGNTERVNSWRGKRVRPCADGTWWSDINPAAQRLARERVLASSDGADAWDQLGAQGAALPFAIHLWYADGHGTPGGTVVELDGEGGINDMQRRLPATKVRFFPGSRHSIHNSAWEAFDEALRDVIQEAATHF